MSCGIFNIPFIKDVDITKGYNIDIKFLKDRIPAYSNDTSGIWQPVYIYPDARRPLWCNPLVEADNSHVKPFNPCECDDSQIIGLDENSYLDPNTNIDCSYCGSYTSADGPSVWSLYDSEGNSSEEVAGRTWPTSCCGGACDIKSHNDDFLPKVPLLNQIYLSGFYDFKYLKQFPACSNPGIGTDKFIEIQNFKTFNITNASFCIDWKIKETISEVEYDSVSSQHINEYHHNKSYQKSQMLSSTCGNFILQSLPTGYVSYGESFPLLADYAPTGTSKLSLYDDRSIEIPQKENYTKPYGFKNRTYDNIFVGKEKVGSYWKWKYDKAILCWYRYYDINRPTDKETRPLPGVDLYISPGDVMWVHNDGPEPQQQIKLSTDNEGASGPSGPTSSSSSSSGSGIKDCPSGIKLIDQNNIVGVIPSGSDFVYISENLYSRFYDLYNIYTEDFKLSQPYAFHLASILCTAPLYDGFTTDLLSAKKEVLGYYPKEQRNEFGQIQILNKLMSQGTEYDSANGVNYITNSNELINTLYVKYGGYVFIPPNTDSSISFTLTENSRSIYIDTDFDLSININDTKFSRATRNTYNYCNSLNFENIRNFSYNQEFSFGSMSLKSYFEPKLRYNQKCETFIEKTPTGLKSVNKLIDSDHTLYGGITFNNNIVQSFPVFSGAYEFVNIYPRVVINPEEIRGYCTDCGEYSSFALADDTDFLCDIQINAASIPDPYNPPPTPAPDELRIMESISSEPPTTSEAPPTEEEDKTFCYSVLANSLNIADTGNRTLRSISDNTEYFTRSYPALAFNPHIDVVAFHQNGGVFYNSVYSQEKTVFDKNLATQSIGSNFATIRFKTNDVGIKLYQILTEKLQSNELGTESCNRFPINTDTTCECYGLNIAGMGIDKHSKFCGATNQSYRMSSLYTPNLSTRYSPKLKYYGGYSDAEILELFGFSNHPARPSGESFLPIVIEKQDPENPYNCYKAASITLNNYTSTSYDIKLNNFNTNHSVISASVYERADLTGGPQTLEQNQDGEDVTVTNVYWKRFLNKVTVQGKTLYNQQEKTIFTAGQGIPNSINVTITNPYLNALIGNSNEQLAFPTGDPCIIVSNETIIRSSRGDETSAITLTFEQKPKKQLLNFKFAERQGYEIDFFNSNFYPNNGLKPWVSSDPFDQKNSKGIDDQGKIDYFHNEYASNIYGFLDPAVSATFDNISNFSMHRKPRLYIKNGSQWYSSIIPNRGGHRLSELDYIGPASFFEYAKSSQDASMKLVPAVPKKAVTLDYTIREQTIVPESDYRAVITPGPSSDIFYHDKDFIYNNKDPRSIRISGTREYFRTRQINKVWTIPFDINQTFEELIATLSEMGIVAQQSDSEEYIKNTIQVYDLIESKSYPGYYVAYIGPDPTNINSYIYIGTNSDIFILKSNLDIDYNRVSSRGYVFNTSKRCEESVAIHYKSEQIQTNTILNKKIYLDFYNKDGQKIKSNDADNKYVKVYTELTFRDKILSQDIDYIEKIQTSSILIYDNIYDLIEKDSLLHNKAYQTKWGDVIKYDGDLLNNPYIVRYDQNSLPNMVYENLFSKQIVNDFDKDFYFNLIHKKGVTEIHLDSQKIALYGQPYFNILQKYDIDKNKTWLMSLDKYMNYLPILEMTLPTRYSFDISQIKGNIRSSALFSSYAKQNIEPDPGFLDFSQPIFFTTAIKKFETAFVPEGDFYSPTLRLDGPAFWLSKTIRKDQTSNRSDARKIFKPTNLNAYENNFSISGFYQVNITRSNPFYLEYAYADLDIADECRTEKCAMSSAGYISLTSQFSVAEPREVEGNIIVKKEIKDNRGFISYDAGLYNPLGDNRYIGITRTELQENNPIEEEITCNTQRPLPLYDTKTFLSSYQDYVGSQPYNYYDKEKADKYHSSNVVAMDQHANEMLFRIYYGEKQKINRKQVYIDNNLLTREDLVQYTDPEITPKYLYDEILYNYDQNASQEISFNGSIGINGTKEVGDVISLNVEGVAINLYISEDEYGSILLTGSVGNQRIKHKLYDRNLILKRLITTDHYVTITNPPEYIGDNGEEDREIDQSPPPDPEPTSDNQTITLLASATYTSSASWSIVQTLNSGINPDDMMPGRGNGTTGVGENLSIIYRTKPQEEFPCHEASKSYDQFYYGYCGIKEGEECDSCDNYIGIEGKGGSEDPNFEYSFEQCSVPFTLRGHAYRKKYSGTNNETPIDEPADDQYSSQNYESTVDLNTFSYSSICGDMFIADCAVDNVRALGYGCWVEQCHPYWINPYTCTKKKNPPLTTLTRKVFLSSTSNLLDAYKPPACPQYFIGISYTNQSVTVSIPDAKATHYVDSEQTIISQNVTYKDYCVPINATKRCPNIYISALPQKYTITESINSSCAECNQNANVGLEKQQNNFTYEDYTAVCEVGRFTYGDINGSPVVNVGFRADDGRDDFGRSLPPCYGNIGGLSALCDGGLPWTSCINGSVIREGKNLQNVCGTNTASDVSIIECDPLNVGVMYKGWLAAENAEIWRENITKQFNKTFLSANGGSSYSGPLHDTNLRPEIPNSQIIQGVIPGSAKLNFETQTVDLPKFRPRPEGGVEESTWSVSVVIAYISYTYRKAKTIDDILIQGSESSDNPESEESVIVKEYDNNGILIGVKTTNNVGSCPFNEFPESYYAYTNSGAEVPLNPTYLSTQPDIEKNTCTDSTKCYDKYEKQQTICNKSDWLCWSFADYRNTKTFLSRIYEENWF